jgi:hypothetical protein
MTTYFKTTPSCNRHAMLVTFCCTGLAVNINHMYSVTSVAIGVNACVKGRAPTRNKSGDHVQLSSSQFQHVWVFHSDNDEAHKRFAISCIESVTSL